jgi:DNA-directed RNA polymerase subunit RPC12/RpoP
VSADQYRCEKCSRPTAKRRLAATAVGALCPRCVDHLPKRLRLPKGNDHE